MNFTFDHARAVAEHVNEVRFFDVLAALNHAATENGASFGPDKDAGAECDNDTMLALAAALAWAWHGWRGFNPSTLALDDAGEARLKTRVMDDLYSGAARGFLHTILIGLAGVGVHLRQTSPKPIAPPRYRLETHQAASGEWFGIVWEDGVGEEIARIAGCETLDDVLDAAAEQWPGIDHIDLPDA